jgi:DnaJ-class molecular chaperone
MTTHYETLGLSESASQDEIKKAYRKLAMQYHPDKNPGDKAAETKFKEINEAYDTLSNSKKRQEYDARRSFGENPFGPQGFNFNMGGAGGIDDIISQFFSQQGFNFHRQAQRNRDVTLNLNISLEDAYFGKNIPVQYNTPSGRKVDLAVNVPAGVESGVRIRYQGQGDHANSNLPPGDLLIQIIINNHKIFDRHGHDLHTKVRVDALKAIIGTKERLACIDNQQIDLTIPAGTQHGTFFRVPNKGMTIRNQPMNKGDLFVHVEVVIPIGLTTDQINSLKTISDSIITNSKE